MKIVNCKIYRCSKQEDMYLYTHASKTINDLPDELINLVKDLTHIMDLELTPERKLAREDITVVINNLEEKGFYLQMPANALIPDLYRGD
jgi:hypothetical protein